jgi:HK97 family phage major capsid protein
VNPLLTADPKTEQLKNADRAAEQAAQEKWKAFEERKRELERDGVDITKDAKSFEGLQQLHRACEHAEKEARAARSAYMTHLEGSNGIGGKKEVLPGAMPDNLSKSVVASLGEKAFDVTAGGTATSAFYDPLLRSLPQRRVFVRSLIPVKQIDTEKFDYLRQTVATFNAAETAAAALKPTSVLSFERVEDRVRTIAHLSEPVDRSALLDLDGMRDFVDTQLRLGVLLREDSQIVNGSGTGENLRGILNTAGILTQARGADAHIDAIFKAITKVRAQVNPFEPNGLAIHPNDLQDVLLTKDANGNYQASDSGALQADDDGTVRVWGLEAISTIAVPEGTAVLGDFQQALIYDREQARVDWADAGGLGAAGAEIFSRNQLVARGEERIGFAVLRPAAFCSVTGM